jgi:hypothetical protein
MTGVALCTELGDLYESRLTVRERSGRNESAGRMRRYSRSWMYLRVHRLAAVQTITTHFGWLDLHARSVPARLSGGEERMGFRLLVQRFGR